jgi:hypothetical protein
MRSPWALILLPLCAPGWVRAQPTSDKIEISIRRVQAPVVVDGRLDEDAWRDATRVDVWFETNPGDNVEPPVKSVGYLGYDDRFFYAAFEFSDPEPGRIRAPLADRDNVGGDTDYGGVILDTRNDGKTGILFLANAHGIQYDAVSDDVSQNEDSSPDFFWDSAGRITETGWTLEIRIPFSSLRYRNADPATWGIMLYRNYPRAYRYQFFSTRLPRGGQCFICYSNRLTGLAGLPGGGHLVLAPYANGHQRAVPEDELGSPLRNESVDGDVGLDVKWTPGADTALDATINPDFSQIESDVAQIGVNERFALLYPEKRPFFLEGVELLTTPIRAVYTRTITSPRWGTRGTGKLGGTAFTAFVAEDRGGGSVILPGTDSSDFAEQDFDSFVAIARVRHDLGRSFVSALATDRELRHEPGHNRVAGPDFQWRLGEQDTLTGQFLYSWSQTPQRPDLAAEWDGRSLAGHGGYGWWSHSTPRIDLYTEYRDFSDEFRADNGFVPEVGYRRVDGEYGYTWRPQGFLRRFRPFALFDYSEDRDGGVRQRQYSFGVGLDARYDTYARIRYAFDHVRAGGMLLPRRQLLYTIRTSPSRLLSGIELEGFLGEQVDFDNVRTGSGLSAALRFVLRPTNHLELRFNNARSFLNVDVPSGSARLFTARVDRLRATYTFTARSFLRLVGQYVETERDPDLYASPVERRSADFGGSALFAYKLNWQTVLFLGYGDERALTDDESWARSSREFFVKVSYAFQR